jgi:hypothetical protein
VSVVACGDPGTAKLPRSFCVGHVEAGCIDMAAWSGQISAVTRSSMWWQNTVRPLGSTIFFIFRRNFTIFLNFRENRTRAKLSTGVSLRSLFAQKMLRAVPFFKQIEVF